MKRRSLLGAGAALGATALGAQKNVAGLPQRGPIEEYSALQDAVKGGVSGYAPVEAEDYVDFLRTQVAKMAVAKTVGLPEGLRNFLIERYAMNDPACDDIEALRSVSSTIKKLMCRERWQERQVQNWMESPARELKRELVKRELRRLGVDWDR